MDQINSIENTNLIEEQKVISSFRPNSVKSSRLQKESIKPERQPSPLIQQGFDDEFSQENYPPFLQMDIEDFKFLNKIPDKFLREKIMKMIGKLMDKAISLRIDKLHTFNNRTQASEIQHLIKYICKKVIQDLDFSIGQIINKSKNNKMTEEQFQECQLDFKIAKTEELIKRYVFFT